MKNTKIIETEEEYIDYYYNQKAIWEWEIKDGKRTGKIVWHTPAEYTKLIKERLMNKQSIERE